MYIFLTVASIWVFTSEKKSVNSDVADAAAKHSSCDCRTAVDTSADIEPNKPILPWLGVQHRKWSRHVFVLTNWYVCMCSKDWLSFRLNQEPDVRHVRRQIRCCMRRLKRTRWNKSDHSRSWKVQISSAVKYIVTSRQWGGHLWSTTRSYLIS